MYFLLRRFCLKRCFDGWPCDRIELLFVPVEFVSYIFLQRGSVSILDDLGVQFPCVDDAVALKIYLYCLYQIDEGGRLLCFVGVRVKFFCSAITVYVHIGGLCEGGDIVSF